MSEQHPDGRLGRLHRRLGRMSRDLARRWTHPAYGGEPGPAALPPALQPHEAKVCDATAAVREVRHGERVFVGGGCATPRTLVRALEALRPRPADVELVHVLADLAMPHDAQGVPQTGFRHRCFFVGADLRAAVQLGLAEYVPVSLARVPALIRAGRLPLDVAFLQVTPPDAFGWVSCGVTVDVLPAVVEQARLVIAEVNPAMPRTQGDALLHVDDLDWLVPVDTPVIEYRHAAVPTPVIERIARYIGGIIDDGATLQIGMGRVSSEVLKYLADRRDLGLHTDVITDAVLPLLRSGVLTGRRKTHQPGRIVTSWAMGSRALYDLLDGNPLFCFEPIERVCDPAVLAAQHRLVSITQAFAIDLTGQVCTDEFEGGFYGGLAAQAEFMRAAAGSEGGKAIVCLQSTDAQEQVSRIQVALGPAQGAGIARSDVHYVVTEYGIAYLFGKSIRERAVALIGLAHPKFRPALLEQARERGLLPEGQQLKARGAYEVEEERTVTLKDGRSVLLRPATPSDAEGIRALFHGLSDRDVYTRFFRNVKSLSSQDVQRLCNIDFDREVAFVAVHGPREHPLVVGHACYVAEHDSGLAETAFMLRHDWQGLGLGSALQARMREHAQAHGFKGFVAEILSTNDAMIRLARAGAPRVDKTSDGSTVRLTAYFAGPADA